MSQSWFPKPTDIEQLALPDSYRILKRPAIFSLLTSPKAEEWKDKVGVISPADGSAKASTRLLLSRGWVFKTNIDETYPDLDAATQHIASLRSKAENITNLWHPEKFWFAIPYNAQFLVISACPKLLSLRSISDWTKFSKIWERVLHFALTLSSKYKIGLDLNPSNFGFDGSSKDLYYIDDELYPELIYSDIAEAICFRNQENPDLTEEQLAAWGRSLYQCLKQHIITPYDWGQFIESLKGVPLPISQSKKQEVLANSLFDSFRAEFKISRRKQKAPASTPPVTNKEPSLTCIFSDVHANLPAFEAVLAECKKRGVDSYIFLGDVVGYGPNPKECLKLLKSLENATLLLGNHDLGAHTGNVEAGGFNRIAREAINWTITQLSAAEREWLGTLGRDFQSDNWIAVHGAPVDESRIHAYVYEMTFKQNLSFIEKQQFQFCFYGHTHVPFVFKRTIQPNGIKLDEKLEPGEIKLGQTGEFLLLNPGSVGQPRNGDPRAAFALWDRKQQVVSFEAVDYDVEQSCKAIIDAGLPEDLAMRLEVGR